jgi:long-chain acyl-CoA synthetase
MEQQLPARETLPALIRRSLAQPRDAALVERVSAGGAWKPTSSAELLARVERLACAIRDAGLEQGDRVALMAADSVDWIVADFATLFAGCVVVPIFPTQAADQVAFILQNSEAKLIFADAAAAARLHGLTMQLPRTIVFGDAADESLAQFEARGEQLQAQHPERPQLFEAAIVPEDMAVLIYTSGTTGEPKGVMLSHYNLGFTAQSSFSYAFDFVPPHSDVLSVLPFSHIYEHCILYGYMLAGVHHHICHSVDELLQDLQAVRPVTMTAVPRVFERMLAGVTAKAKMHGGLQAKLVPWALEIGRRYMSAKVGGARYISPLLTLQYGIAHALVLKKLRPRLGLDRLKYLVSGSAPLHFDTAMTMLAADIVIVEGYGPTECSPVITVNRFNENHYGTVGKTIPGVEIKLAPDGEILARGPNVMMGYYKNPQATAEAIEDGWYRTGDVGTIDAGGYLHITDRKKELFKTSGGKFVAPSRVEAAIKRSVYINQVMLVGDDRPHPVALISPNWDLVRTELNIASSAPVEQLAVRADIVAFLTAQVRRNTADLATFEQVRKIIVLPRELTVENGELSPTLKVKRRVVEARYAADIERLYAAAAMPASA